MIVKKDELEVLRAVNNPVDEYASEDEFLKAMFNTVVELLSKRDSWGVGVRYSDSSGVTPFGPWYNKAQATKAGKAVGGALSVSGKKIDVFLQQLNAPSKLHTEENISE